MIEWLSWPAPANVKACYSRRAGGVSKPPYDSFNLGAHVGDNAEAVSSNRAVLMRQLEIHAAAPTAKPTANSLAHIATTAPTITWLQQVHGTLVAELPLAASAALDFDAASTCQPMQGCCVMTADCLPVFFCNQQGTRVAVAHAGWRGLLNGVLQNTLASFTNPSDVMCYLGPAISQAAFEVGPEVREAFVDAHAVFARFFVPSTKHKHWFADLYGIARQVVTEQGVGQCYGGEACTFEQEELFFSYRRDGTTGRMAHVIWLTE